jgi:organic radical activating enzyme
MFVPTEELARLVDWWNCSPKLSNNLLDSEEQIVPEALGALVATGKADFKFVLQAPHEIEEVIGTYLPLLPPDRIMIMPEGQTCARQLNAMSEIADICLEYGFRLSPRLHTLIWDNERGR